MGNKRSQCESEIERGGEKDESSERKHKSKNEKERERERERAEEQRLKAKKSLGSGEMDEIGETDGVEKIS